MPSYVVTVPYDEKELGKDPRRHLIDLSIEANGPLEAISKAVEQFERDSGNPHVSWNVFVDKDGINVREMTTGKMFRIADIALGNTKKQEEEKLLSMEEYLRQFDPEPTDQLRAYEAAFEIIASSKDYSQAAQKILQITCDALTMESGAVLMIDSNQRELTFAAAVGPKSKEIMDFRVPKGQGIAGFCAGTGETIAVSDVKKDPRFYKKISESIGYETRCILATPIAYRGKTFGVLELINRAVDDHFNGNDMTLAHNMAQALSLLHLSNS